jgi:hypothetical protein
MITRTLSDTGTGWLGLTLDPISCLPKGEADA